MPKLATGQLVKVVVTRGTQTFTAVFNDRGQAVGGTEATSARYTLKQGQATVIQINLRLTAGTTGATQSFEGALRLTFQLPADKSGERRSATLDAARKAALALEEALAKKPEVAGRIVSSLSGSGDTTQLETFRTAITNLGLFTDLFRAVQGELLAVSLEKLIAPPEFDPIRARHFPLDDVVITTSGLLGFSGQKQPITLAGQVQSNFVPSAGRRSGGGSSGGSSGEGSGGGYIHTGPRIVEIAYSDLSRPSHLSDEPVGLAYLWRPITANSAATRLVYGAYYGFGLLSHTPPAPSAGEDGFTTDRALDRIPYWPAQARTASGTLYFGDSYNPNGLGFYEPDGGATGVIQPSGYFRALAADAHRLYYTERASNAPVQWAAHGNVQNASGTFTLSGGQGWSIEWPTAMAIYSPNADGTGSPTLFIGTDEGYIYAAKEGEASRTIGYFGSNARIRALAFATPTLYVSRDLHSPLGDGTAYELTKIDDINNPSTASGPLITGADIASAVSHTNGWVAGNVEFEGLALDGERPYLYAVESGTDNRILRIYLGDLGN